MTGYRLQLVLRDHDGDLLVAEDVDCSDLATVMMEFGSRRDGITSRRFLDTIESAFRRGSESLAREFPPVLRGEPIKIRRPA